MTPRWLASTIKQETFLETKTTTHMATTSEILDLGAQLKEVSFENFEAGDKVLMLLDGVRITLDNTRDESKRSIEQRDNRISEQDRELSDRIAQMQAIEARSAVREAEYTRQSNAFAELSGNYAKTSAYLEEVKNTVVLTSAQLAQVEAAATEAGRSFAATIEAKDALTAEEVKAKLDALDQVAKLGTDVAALMETINSERLAREEMIKSHETDNDKILAMVQDLFTAEKEEDKDLRDASAGYEGSEGKGKGKGGYEG